jgi:hypothetical protein
MTSIGNIETMNCRRCSDSKYELIETIHILAAHEEPPDKGQIKHTYWRCTTCGTKIYLEPAFHKI